MNILPYKGEDAYKHPYPITIKARVLEKEEGLYTTYVFQDLDTKDYLVVTQYPNWIQPIVNINDVGYLTYYIIIAGVTSWYAGVDENKTKCFSPYNYTHLAFIKFINSDTLNNIDSDNSEKIKII